MNRSVTIDAPRTYPALSLDDLRRTALSLFAENARPGVSRRYTSVSTAQVVDLLRGEGWEPVLARQQRVRLPERQGFQMHEVRFTRPDYLDQSMFAVGDVRPELILQNAHVVIYPDYGHEQMPGDLDRMLEFVPER